MRSKAQSGDTRCRSGAKTRPSPISKDLHAQFEKLARTRALWRRPPRNLVVSSDVDVAVYLGRYREHLIFFRELPSGAIGIMSVLHSKSDLPVRPSKDLHQFDKTGGFEE